MAMMKTRKPKRYASGGPVDTSNFPKVINMPSTGYVAGRDPEHIFFQKSPTIAAQDAAPVDINIDVGGGGGGGDGGGSGDGGGGGGDGGGGYAKGGAVKAKKMAGGGAVKSKMGRGDGCAMRGRTKGRMV